MKRGFGLIYFLVSVVVLFALIIVVLKSLERTTQETTGGETIFEAIDEAEVARDIINSHSIDIGDSL